MGVMGRYFWCIARVRAHMHAASWPVRALKLLDDPLMYPDGVVRVLWQSELTVSNTCGPPLPLPTGPLKGKVYIGVTFCYCDRDRSSPPKQLHAQRR